ncbi:MAG TPA: SAF domain-containing protein [Negativicutes bacterium]|nr:SAF domain-containing protein [Negativicutes bacterium]
MSYGRKFISFAARKRMMLSAIFIILTAITIYEAFLLYHSSGPYVEAEAGKTVGDASPVDTAGILRAVGGMEQGAMLDAGNVEMIEVPRELAPEGAVSSLEEIKGMRLRHKIAGKELLNKLDLIPDTAVFEAGDRLMEHGFQDGTVPATVVEGSAIDIKLFVRGGEDPVVVSKTVVVSREANLLSFYLDEREQECIKEAAAEGMLFAVQYLDDSQTPSRVTYSTGYFKEDNSNAR